MILEISKHLFVIVPLSPLESIKFVPWGDEKQPLRNIRVGIVEFCMCDECVPSKTNIMCEMRGQMARRGPPSPPHSPLPCLPTIPPLISHQLLPLQTCCQNTAGLVMKSIYQSSNQATTLYYPNTDFCGAAWPTSR